jgi:hypothetical protein
MATLYKIENKKSYATEANAVKAVTAIFGAYPEVRYFVQKTEDNRYIPVCIGVKALQLGAHFHFNVVA